MARFIGLDLGAETLKAAELVRSGDGWTWARRACIAHGKDPGGSLLRLLGGWDWDGVAGAAVTGRLGRLVALARVPGRQALAAGFRFRHGNEPATIVSIGSRGFSVLELRGIGHEVYRENGRCAQGTGNFLQQLVGRFGLTVEEASALAQGVTDPAPLSGRCPVILKTDMTHLANKGESRERILAGLLDAIAENVQALLKPKVCPERLLLAGGVARSARIQAHFRRHAEAHGMTYLEAGEDDRLYLEALGCALLAAEAPGTLPELEALLRHPDRAVMEASEPLSFYLDRVRRLPGPPEPLAAGPVETVPVEVIVGFDIGSTGSKAVALEPESGSVLWEAYLPTDGAPVAAAQALMRNLLAGTAAAHHIRGFGVTGSGREIVGSLLVRLLRPGGGVRAQRDRRPRHRRPAVRSAGGHHLRDRRPGRQIHPARRRQGGGRGHERGLLRWHRLLHRGAGAPLHGHRLRGAAGRGGAVRGRTASPWASTARSSWPRSSTRPWPPAFPNPPSSRASTTPWWRTT